MRERPTLDETQTLTDYIWISRCDDPTIIGWNLTQEELDQIDDENGRVTRLIVGVKLYLVDDATQTGPVRR